MRTFYNDCREGQKPKYFTMTLNGYNYVYSNMDDVKHWKEVEKLAGNVCKSGVLTDNIKSDIKIIKLQVKQAELRQNREQLRIDTNTKGL